MKGRLALLVAWTLLVTGSLYGGDAAKDRQAMQGSWEMIETTVDGKKAMDGVFPEFLKSRLIVTSNRMKLVMKSGGKEMAKEYSFELNPSKQPKEIDVVALNSTCAGDKGKGLYKVDGDTLTLILANKSDTPRPKSFESKAGSNLVLMILKKAKPK